MRPTDRTAAAKKAWETIRARKAAGINPPQSPESTRSPGKDEQAARLRGLLEEWIKPRITAVAA